MADCRSARSSWEVRTKRRRHRSWYSFGRLLGIAGLLGIGLIIALWLALMYKPSWYRPVSLDEAACQQARNQAVAVADDVSDQMVERHMFDFVLHDRTVNGWLAALPQIWPDAQDVLPPWVTDPAIGFDNGEVCVGARCTTDRWQAIVSVGVCVGVSEDGDSIEVALSGASGGALPIPQRALERLLNELRHSMQVQPEYAAQGAEPIFDALREIESVDDLFEGIRITNRFVWFNGDRPFRIDSVEIDDGALRLRIEPL